MSLESVAEQDISNVKGGEDMNYDGTHGGVRVEKLPIFAKIGARHSVIAKVKMDDSIGSYARGYRTNGAAQDIRILFVCSEGELRDEPLISDCGLANNATIFTTGRLRRGALRAKRSRQGASRESRANKSGVRAKANVPMRSIGREVT